MSSAPTLCRLFPGHGQMKYEQQEIERLKREVTEGGAGYPKKLSSAVARLRGVPRPSSRGKRHEVRLHREAPGYLAGGMAVRSNGRIPVGLPCLAEPLAQRQIPK